MSANDEFTSLKDPEQFAVERLVESGADVGRDPDSVAIVDGDRTRTYAQLNDAASRVANGLAGLGLAHDDRVAFVGRNCVESAELMLGAARAGVVLTIVNWRLQPGELSFVLHDSAAVVVVTTIEFAETLRALPEIAGVRQFLVVDSPIPADDWSAWIGRQPLGAVTVERNPNDVVVQLYTSGTTGRPKGAMLTRSSLAACIPDTAALWELDQTSVVLSVLPMFHIAGAGTLLGALWAGCRLIMDNDASTTGILRAVERHRVTNLVLASVMLQGLVRSPECATADLSSVRTVSYGAAPIPSDVLNAARAKLPCRIMQPYGLTETTGVLTVLGAQDHAFDPNGPDAPAAVARLRSCGRPRAGVEIRVVDIQTGSPLAAGESGEVQARSPRLMAGYWNQPEATAEVLLPDGWFRTGDVGQVDEDGYLSCSTASRTPSSPAARTSTRPKSKRSFTPTRASPRLRSSAFLTSAGARRPWRSSSATPDPTSAKPTSSPSPAPILPDTSVRAASSSPMRSPATRRARSSDERCASRTGAGMSAASTSAAQRADQGWAGRCSPRATPDRPAPRGSQGPGGP